VLEALHELRDSITPEQREKIEEKLPEKILMRLDIALSSETQEEADSNVESFAKAMKKRPMKALALYRIMDKRQKEIVLSLMGDDE